MEHRRSCKAIPWMALFLALAAAVPCRAFHSGGIGDCYGCHGMHLPAGDSGAVGGNPYSLNSTDAGSVCLNCHHATGEGRPNGHLVSTADTDMPSGCPPVQLTPGGDFGWLKKSYRWEAGDQRGAGNSPGERHGHSIVAADFQYLPDTVLTTAPGGTFPSSKLSCISCHDHHGKYRRFADGSIGMEGVPIQSSGSYDTSPKPTPTMAVGVYRLLGGKGYSTAATRNAAFLFDPPATVAPEDYNREEGSNETRVAYGSGMSEWCANCHGAFLTGSEGARVHPSGRNVRLSPAVIANYNTYVASGNLTGGRATAYTSMVPYEMGTADYDLLQRTANSHGGTAAGPDPDANVACLSCHRAHASGWDHAARWNMKTEFLVFDGEYPGVEDTAVPARISQGRTRAETRRTFYERPATRYAFYQRSLCNKCHALD